jgi:hypothetical protein
MPARERGRQMRRTIIGLAGALALAVLAPTSALADGYDPVPCDGKKLIGNECPPAPPVDDSLETCPANSVALRIAERRPRHDPKFQTVTVTATNLNTDTGGALDATLVVTYQANRGSSLARVITSVEVADGSSTYSATFDVPRFRDVDGRVVATLEDVGCDGQNEVVSLA